MAVAWSRVSSKEKTLRGRVLVVGGGQGRASFMPLRVQAQELVGHLANLALYARFGLRECLYSLSNFRALRTEYFRPGSGDEPAEITCRRPCTRRPASRRRRRRRSFFRAPGISRSVVDVHEVIAGRQRADPRGQRTRCFSGGRCNGGRRSSSVTRTALGRRGRLRKRTDDDGAFVAAGRVTDRHVAVQADRHRPESPLRGDGDPAAMAFPGMQALDERIENTVLRGCSGPAARSSRPDRASPAWGRRRERLHREQALGRSPRPKRSARGRAQGPP